MMREVSPQKVADGVLKAIRGSLEVLVTPMPIRPLLALNQMFPSLQRPIIKRMGIDRAMRGPRRDDAPTPTTMPFAETARGEAEEPETADVAP